MTRLTIDPITRLEGHGKIEIFLDDRGEVERTYFQVPELRGFESFCVGRPVEEMPVLTNRICGVCPEAHHLAAAKAADAVYRVDPPRTAKLLRELLYCAFFVTDHTTHFYALGGPDIFVGPDAPVAERNILGVIRKVGLEVGGRVIETRRAGHRVIELIGGRAIHPCTSVPGGLTHGIGEDARAEIEQIARSMLDFAGLSLDLFDRTLTGDPATRDLLLGDLYRHETYYAGLVDERGRVALYDGRVSVVAPDGERLGTYAPADYRDWIAEHVEPWTYLKFPYLRQVGWRGFVDGKDSGIYCVGPLGRLNAADGMATPRAQEAYERFYATLAPPVDGQRALVHQRGASHWARLIEMLYAAERMIEIVRRPRDHLRRRAGRPDRDADRGRRHGRGAARNADPPLLDRRARDPHRGQPHRRHDEQPRPDRDVDRSRRPGAHPVGGRRRRRPARPDRDGVPGLRPVLRLRHPLAARPDAARGHDPRRDRRDGRGPPRDG